MSILKTILITGGSGFLGEIVERAFIKQFPGVKIVNVDIHDDNFAPTKDAKGIIDYYKIDISDIKKLESVFKKYKFDAIIHLAAILAHEKLDKNFLWESNVTGTKNVAQLATKYNVNKIIFTSSNCLWAKNFHRPVMETDTPEPVELYGKSKLEGENLLIKESTKNKNLKSIIFRCPTIMDEGRLGLLAILFEFIDEGRKVWLVGEGKNTYQFIYAKDLVNAIFKAFDYKKSEIFNIGSDNVPSLKEVYEYVISKAGTKARVASLNRPITLFGMKVAYKLGMSPLGPYQYKMIAEDFVFDTSKIKKELNWKPSLNNNEMLYRSYNYYHTNLKTIKDRKDVSAHKRPAKMGIIRVLKWIS